MKKWFPVNLANAGWGLNIFRFSTAAVLIVCLMLCGCTLTLIGNYDDIIDKGMTDFQQKVEAYMTKLESNPSMPYDAAFYDDAYAQLATMKTRAQASYKKDILVQQIDELKATLDDFQKGDNKIARNDKGQVNTQFVTDAQKTIETEIESIFKLELALKRGKDPATTSK